MYTYICVCIHMRVNYICCSPSVLSKTPKDLCVQVLFVFRRCPRGEDGDNGGSVGTPVMEDDRMGFIMFEAGLENMALR